MTELAKKPRTPRQQEATARLVALTKARAAERKAKIDAETPEMKLERLTKEKAKRADETENQIRNPITGRMVNKDSPKGKAILETKKVVSDVASAEVAQLPSEELKIKNPETGRMVLRTSVIGKRVLKNMALQSSQSAV